MTISKDERWQQLSRLLDEAMDLSEAERAPWLDALRNEDPEIAGTLQRALADRDSAVCRQPGNGKPQNQGGAAAGCPVSARLLIN